MKEKFEIRKTYKKSIFKNGSIEEVTNIKDERTIFRVFENEELCISYLKGDINDEKGYQIAYKNKKYPYTHTTKLNTQQNVIAKRSNLKEKDIMQITSEIATKLYCIDKEVKIDYTNINYRYNLTNSSKLHMNFEDERNIFYINMLGHNFTFNYRSIDVEKIVDDIKRYIDPIINNKYIDIQDITEKNIIIPSNLNIYDFFEYFLTCKNIISNKLSNVEIFSDKLSLYTSLAPSDTKSEKYGVLPFFDWEGSYNPYYKTALIDYGTIVKPYSNKDLAKNYEIENTCCSYAIKDDYPSCKLLGAYIQNGDDNLDDMIKSAIFIDEADIKTEKENISFYVKRAYLYKSGKFINIIKSFSFNVNAFRMFGNKFVGASKDMLFNSDLKRAIVFEDII